MRTMGRDPTHTIAGRFERYGDLYQLDFFGRSVYVTRHPEHIQQVLITQAERFEKPRQGIVANNLRRLLGEGLLLSNGELWRRQRRLIQPAFRRERLDQYAQLVIGLAEDFAARLQDRQELDVSRSMMDLTLHIVSKALFNHDVASDRDRVARAVHAFRRAFGGIEALLPRSLGALPTPRNRGLRRAIADLDALIYGLIDQRSGARASSAVDLLSALASAVDREGDGGGMERTLIRDELLTLLLAGHETTSHALSWTFHLLSQHPEVEARVRHEVLSVLGARRPEPGDVDKLHYTEQVLNESMRLYPPAYVLARVCTQDAHVGGYTIPAGSDLIIWTYHVQRDARWFPDPTRFDPDRFSPARKGTIPQAAYLPFGLGTRTCIGKHFALMEAKLVLACTLRRVSLHDLRGGVAERDMAVTLAPRGGLPMRVSVPS
ncbi:MAG: Cytochrome [Myxococcaceae bacterium]|nr:Cytochrome [Myxococcaceae bacterium]